MANLYVEQPGSNYHFTFRIYFFSLRLIKAYFLNSQSHVLRNINTNVSQFKPDLQSFHVYLEPQLHTFVLKLAFYFIISGWFLRSMYICVLSVIKVLNEMGTCWNNTILEKKYKKIKICFNCGYWFCFSIIKTSAIVRPMHYLDQCII